MKKRWACACTSRNGNQLAVGLECTDGDACSRGAIDELRVYNEVRAPWAVPPAAETHVEEEQ